MQNKGSLHNKFEGFGAQPSENLWNSIASNLDQKKKRRGIIFWWLGSGFTAVLVIFLGVRFMNDSNDNTTSNQLVDNINHTEKVEVLNTTNVKHEESIQITNLSNDNSNSEAQINTQRTSPNQVNIDPNTSLTKDSNTNKIELTNNEEVFAQNENNQKFELVAEKRNKTFIEKFHLPVIPELSISRNSELGMNEIEMPKSKSKWMYSFNIQSQKGFELPKPTYEAENEMTNNPNLFDLASEPIIAKTFRPLTVHFGMGKQLNKRLSFQSGIDVGWIQTNSGLSKTSLFSIGIPVKLNLTMIERKRGAFYTDFGLVNEIPVISITRNLTGSNYTSTSSKFVSGFLGGTELGLGFNYKLNENLKFDINSGFKWYYYQKVNDINTLTSQNVFLTFQAGIIWNY